MAQEPAVPASRRPGPARLALRDGTRALHERMHAHPRLLRLAEGCIGPAEYAALLRDFLRFHRLVEDRLSRGPALGKLGIDLARRRRARDLEEDLDALGVAVPDGAAIAGCALGVPRSVAAALGYLYVVEGSRLGGRVLAGALDAAIPAAGRRFLLGREAAEGHGWAELCAALEDGGTTPATRQAMVGAARATFAALDSCLAGD